MTEQLPSAAPSRAARARNTAAELSVKLESTALGRVWSRLLEVEFVDRSVALAAKAFVSLFPFLILATALTPDSVREEVVESLTNRFGITGAAFDTIRQAFASADQTRAASGIIGALITVAFAVSFTTALQRTYLRAWRRPPGGGAENKGRGADLGRRPDRDAADVDVDPECARRRHRSGADLGDRPVAPLLGCGGGPRT